MAYSCKLLFRKLKQEDSCKIQASLGYGVESLFKTKPNSLPIPKKKYVTEKLKGPDLFIKFL